jgi:hypothetical protein
MIALREIRFATAVLMGAPEGVAPQRDDALARGRQRVHDRDQLDGQGRPIRST